MPRKAKEKIYEKLNSKNIKEKKKDASKSTKTNKKKSITSVSKKKTSSNKTSPVEYYDLPNRYNKTMIKILAQTPKTLFVYWEISDEDINKFKNQYGDNFFEITKPVLIVHNNTLNYSFEEEINDYANSWYLKVNDSKSDYKVELSRKPINNSTNENNYICISSSNKIESPNDHILFNDRKTITFRNAKTNQKIEKSISSFSSIRNQRKIYNIYDSYKDDDSFIILSNPSSHTSSQFK